MTNDAPQCLRITKGTGPFNSQLALRKPHYSKSIDLFGPDTKESSTVMAAFGIQPQKTPTRSGSHREWLVV